MAVRVAERERSSSTTRANSVSFDNSLDVSGSKIQRKIWCAPKVWLGASDAAGLSQQVLYGRARPCIDRRLRASRESCGTHPLPSMIASAQRIATAGRADNDLCLRITIKQLWLLPRTSDRDSRTRNAGFEGASLCRSPSVPCNGRQ